MKTNKISVLLLMMLPLLGVAQNVVKFYPGPLVNKNLRFGYERVLNDRLSASIDLGYAMPRPFLVGLSGRIGDTTGAAALVEDALKVQGFNANVQLRFYPGGEAPKGFFVAPYLRYSNVAGGLNDVSLTTDLTGSLNLGLSSTALGAMFGYQFLIADRVTIDWQIVGLGITRYTFKIKAQVAGGTGDFNQFVDDVNQVIEQYNSIPGLPNVPVTADVSNGIYQAKPSFFSPSIRSNIGIGVKF